MGVHRPVDSLRRWPDFRRYALALVATRDVDPVYPLLAEIVRREGFEPEWFAFVYVLYYSLGSAVRFCRAVPEAKRFEPARWRDVAAIRHFGVERRGTQRVAAHQRAALSAWREAAPDVRKWQARGDSLAFRRLLAHLPLMGDWASFKLCEVTEKALGFKNLAPQTMEIAARPVNGSVGPAGGCRELYGAEATYPPSVAREWEALGRTLCGALDTGLGEVETALCKWAKVVKGQYFIGHDIHEFVALKPLWDAPTYNAMMRACGFHPRFFLPLDVAQAKRAYRDTGQLLFTDCAPTSPAARRTAPCPAPR